MKTNSRSVKYRIEKFIYELFPLKHYGYYLCTCNNFHYGWYKKQYGKDGWYLITKVNKSICKENRANYQLQINNHCLPQFKPKYDKHYYRKKICIRCGKQK